MTAPPFALPTVRVVVASAVARAGFTSLLSAAVFAISEGAEVWIVDDSALADLSVLDDAPAVVAVGSVAWANLLPDLLEGGWAALDSGATPAELVAGVLGAAAGLVVLPPTQVPPAIHDDELNFDDLDVSLTPREREVLALLSEGLSNKRAAKTLGVSESTVKFHAQAIYSKLGVQSRAAAVSRGIQLGLVSV
ncbi:DNA-binding response regulator [Deinococcus cavernae]|uniref:DNA-binding response regulator n=1 Tax=Deinococcus cavernae TaxID=2320857 RepID=A0A418V638_9DEIO|nr:response regulator transcription factor [Deinococcus cavernae]RJF71539.1 DNA-binding response regulator [Deinococcus cavernae]